jgi:hypothetical protein
MPHLHIMQQLIIKKISFKESKVRVNISSGIYCYTKLIKPKQAYASTVIIVPNITPTKVAMAPLMATPLPIAPLPVALGMAALPEWDPLPEEPPVPVAAADGVAELGKAVAAAANNSLDAKV